MLRKQKKLSKQEMKEDKVADSYVMIQDWIVANQKVVLYVLGGIVAVLLATFLFIQKRNEWNDTAATQLAKILPAYERGAYDQAIAGIPQEGAQGLESIVSEYGSTQSGELAGFYLANAYFHLGNYEKALDAFKDVDVNDKLVTASAYAGIAACYEEKGEREDAAEYFEKAAFKEMTAMYAPENLQNAAVNYAAIGKKEKAVELLKTLKKEFPQSTLARDVDRYISEYSS